MKSAVVQSVFDFAIREINALEQRIAKAEDGADAMLWEQADQVVKQLDERAGSFRKLAAKWINARTGKPYSPAHVQFVAQVYSKLYRVVPRPRFRDAYNEIANEKTNKLAVHHSSKTPEHYTPPVIIEHVLACFGAIDLDPCANPNAIVPAGTHFMESDDGLAQPWQGRVYMNPPYGTEIDAWIDKFCTEYGCGHVSEAIALVPGRIDTQWFKRLRDFVCCFIAGRLTFIGNEDPAPFPSVVVYAGKDIDKFYRTFADLGDVWRRIEPGTRRASLR